MLYLTASLDENVAYWSARLNRPILRVSVAVMVKLIANLRSRVREANLKQEFEKRLSAVAAAGGNLLYGGLKGIEKESLRVSADGNLSMLGHPNSLGSALTNRFITTDFSEALLEFVTPAFETTWEALNCICDIHQFTYSSLGDEMFREKVVVVNIAGTWCPNCHDEAQFLAALHKEYGDRGLEVIGLMYEHFEDRQIAVRQINRFREKFGIQYMTLVAGISDKTEVSKTLPSLSAVLAFPTTIFIDRKGQVRVIHTGFSGPGTGKHHEQLKEEFTNVIVELLEESVDQDT